MFNKFQKELKRINKYTRQSPKLGNIVRKFLEEKFRVKTYQVEVTSYTMCYHSFKSPCLYFEAEDEGMGFRNYSAFCLSVNRCMAPDDGNR